MQKYIHKLRDHLAEFIVSLLLMWSGVWSEILNSSWLIITSIFTGLQEHASFSKIIILSLSHTRGRGGEGGSLAPRPCQRHPCWDPSSSTPHCHCHFYFMVSGALEWCIIILTQQLAGLKSWPIGLQFWSFTKAYEPLPAKTMFSVSARWVDFKAFLENLPELHLLCQQDCNPAICRAYPKGRHQQQKICPLKESQGIS